jgi:hypothetical protein
MGEAMKIYADTTAPGMKITPISTRMLSIMGALTFNMEWKSMAILMRHYERWGEDGSPDEANRLLGTPAIRLKDWCRAI